MGFAFELLPLFASGPLFFSPDVEPAWLNLQKSRHSLGVETATVASPFPLSSPACAHPAELVLYGVFPPELSDGSLFLVATFIECGYFFEISNAYL